MSDLVLVSGGSGFMAAHIIVQLVAAGYRVRTTVRSAGRAAVVRDMLIDLIRRLVAGQMPACPDLWFGVVDVRDAASLHLLVMASPEAADPAGAQSGRAGDRRGESGNEVADSATR